MSVFADLQTFSAAPGPFFTVTIPTPSHLDDARHRMEVNWRNALGDLGDEWSEAETGQVDELVRGLPHDGGAALVVAHARGGPTLLEFIDEPVHGPVTCEGPTPRLITVIEARQRARAHVVVETDRAGADIHAFDGGDVIGTDRVDGDTVHIHRGHPGGWSQRRFQQRAENTWERNADDVAAAIDEVDRRVGAEMVFVAGDVRACSLVLEALPHRVRDHAVKIEAGSPEGIADEVVRLLADRVARDIRDAAEQLRSRLGDGTATVDGDAVVAALGDGRVARLLVRRPDGDDEVVDAAVVAALRSDAEITVVPTLDVMTGPIAALLRW